MSAWPWISTRHSSRGCPICLMFGWCAVTAPDARRCRRLAWVAPLSCSLAPQRRGQSRDGDPGRAVSSARTVIRTADMAYARPDAVVSWTWISSSRTRSRPRATYPGLWGCRGPSGGFLDGEVQVIEFDVSRSTPRAFSRRPLAEADLPSASRVGHRARRAAGLAHRAGATLPGRPGDRRGLALGDTTPLRRSLGHREYELSFVSIRRSAPVSGPSGSRCVCTNMTKNWSSAGRRLAGAQRPRKVECKSSRS